MRCRMRRNVVSLWISSTNVIQKSFNFYRRKINIIVQFQWSIMRRKLLRLVHDFFVVITKFIRFWWVMYQRIFSTRFCDELSLGEYIDLMYKPFWFVSVSFLGSFQIFRRWFWFTSCNEKVVPRESLLIWSIHSGEEKTLLKDVLESSGNL